MLSPRLRYVMCLSPAGLHRMAYREWGDAANPRVLVCVHGLTRCASDFDVLAQALSDDFRVICPDVVGRGASDWLVDPIHYQLPQYVADMHTLLSRIDACEVNWLGTSMGGLIGMCVAGYRDSAIHKLLINDVGPALSPLALTRIAAFLGNAPTFDSQQAGLAYLKNLALPFGAHSDAQWHQLLSPCLIYDWHQQHWRLHYDPNIAAPFKLTTPAAASSGELLLWKTYDAIRCPTLVVRGEYSDLLTRETLSLMQQCGPKAQAIEIPGVGHAPTFMQPEQVAIAKQFFV